MTDAMNTKTWLLFNVFHLGGPCAIKTEGDPSFVMGMGKYCL